MHGRVKVKTSAEKAAEKQKERDKRKEVYKACMAKIRVLYFSGDRSAKLLTLITGVLESLPEFGTLWNWRREILIAMFRELEQDLTSVDIRSSDNTTSPDVLKSRRTSKHDLIESEKEFVGRCLRVNPKAYALWSHRRWLLEQNLTPGTVAAELELCAAFFRLDDRNFHCWDYRRFVVGVGQVVGQGELDLTTFLIEKNFSNYSAWHYRSTLLAAAGGCHDNRSRVPVDVVRRELEWTENAYFTDPTDQSVWLYHQWLLGRQPPLDRVLAVTVEDVDEGAGEQVMIVVMFEKQYYTCPRITVVDDAAEGKSDVHLNFTSSRVPSRVWHACVSRDRASRVRALEYGETKLTVVPGTHPTVPHVTPRHGYMAPPELVEEQLSNIRELHELEPDNKWCMLALVNMTHSFYPVKSGDVITRLRDLIVKLCHVDGKRVGYYRDLWSRVLCETAVESWWRETVPSGQCSNSPSGQCPGSTCPPPPLNLSRKYLTVLAAPEFLYCVREVNLSHNALTGLEPIGSLVLLRKLDVSHNKLPSLDGLEKCQYLCELDVSHNAIANTCGLLPCTKCRITSLSLAGNPITEQDVYPDCVLESFVMLCRLDGKEL